MRQLTIQLDDPTYRALNRVAAKREQADFVRAAIWQAIREKEEARTRLAYIQQPDSQRDAEGWSNAEEWTL